MRQLIIIIFVLSFCGCIVPQYIWPQHDISFYEIKEPNLDNKILIASRKSDFKNSIIQKITEAYGNQPVYIKITGIENLNHEDANRYSAIVLINTSIAWNIDRKVEQFLNKYGEMDSIIVLTTADGGDIIPDMKNRNIDAISSASVDTNIKTVSEDIISKIDTLIEIND